MKLKDRYTKKTPTFFRKLRNIGIALAAAGGVLLTAPISLPAIVITIAGYLAVAGTVATTVSQAVISDNNKDADFDNDLNEDADLDQGFDEATDLN